MLEMLNKVVLDSPIFFMMASYLIFMNAFKDKYTSGNKIACSGIVRCLAAVGCIVAARLFAWYFIDADTIWTLLEEPFCITAAYLYALLVLRYSANVSFYMTVWCYLLTETAMQLLMPLYGKIANRLPDAFYVPVSVLVICAGIGGIYFLVFHFLRSKLRENNGYHIGRQKMLLASMVLCIHLVLGNYQFIFWLFNDASSGASGAITVFRLLLCITCILFLYIQNSIEEQQHAEQELAMARQIWHEKQNQYRMSQENIDLINRKCHDLKYQMSVLRRLKDEQEIDEQLKELERSTLIYDSNMETGNPVLDTVLTEKSLYCEAHQINLTCMVDGENLDFIGKVDLYTMFSNAVDNAIENVMKQENPEKRIIQVSACHEKDFLMIRVRNYCEDQLRFVEGMPVTTKGDKGYHGFGLKSIRYTVEKYGGGLTCQLCNCYFTLQILIPVTENVKIQ